MKEKQEWVDEIELKVSQIALKYEDKRDGKNLLPKAFWTETKKYIFILYFKSGILVTSIFALLFVYLLFTQNFSAFLFWGLLYVIYLLYLYMQTLSWIKSVKKTGVGYLQQDGKSGEDLL